MIPRIRIGLPFKIAAIAAGVLLLLTLMVQTTTPLDDVDRLVMNLAAIGAESPLWPAILWCTNLGGGSTILPIMVLISLFLLRSAEDRLIIPQWGGYLGARLITDGLKQIVARDRPELTDIIQVLTQATSPSFPSGHATSAIYVYGFILLLTLRSRISPFLCGPLALLLFAAIIGVAASRIFLGVHYASDVLGGLLAGGLALALVSPTIHKPYSR